MNLPNIFVGITPESLKSPQYSFVNCKHAYVCVRCNLCYH